MCSRALGSIENQRGAKLVLLATLQIRDVARRRDLARVRWRRHAMGIGVVFEGGGATDTDGTIQPASARGDGLWPAPADVLVVRTGHTFMAEKNEVIAQTAHFLAHCRCAR